MAQRQSLKNICRLIESVQEELPLEQAFLGDLKRSIELTAKADSREPSKTYKPSSLTCIRNMYYQVMGYEQDEGTSPYTLVGICNSGSDIHERVQTYVSRMKENGIDCEYVDVAEFVKSRGLDEDIDIVSKQGMETKLYHKKYNMSFLCDGIIRYRGKYYILELKTESAYKWQGRQGVDPKHYKQGTAYSIAFEIPQVIFVYINRDILDMKAFVFEPTGEMKADLVGSIEQCNEYVNRKQVPPKPADVPKSSCEYCSYRGTCRKERE